MIVDETGGAIEGAGAEGFKKVASRGGKVGKIKLGISLGNVRPKVAQRRDERFGSFEG